MLNDFEKNIFIAQVFDKHFQEIFDLIDNSIDPKYYGDDHGRRMEVYLRYARVLVEEIEESTLDKFGYIAKGEKLDRLHALCDALKQELINFQNPEEDIEDAN